MTYLYIVQHIYGHLNYNKVDKLIHVLKFLSNCVDGVVDPERTWDMYAVPQ